MQNQVTVTVKPKYHNSVVLPAALRAVDLLPFAWEGAEEAKAPSTDGL